MLPMNHINSEARDSLNGCIPFRLSQLLLNNALHKLLKLREISADELCSINCRQERRSDSHSHPRYVFLFPSTRIVISPIKLRNISANHKVRLLLSPVCGPSGSPGVSDVLGVLGSSSPGSGVGSGVVPV